MKPVGVSRIVVLFLFVALSLWGANYYIERFGNLNKCDIVKTTGDWHLFKDYWGVGDSTYGSGGGRALPETVFVSVAGIPVSFAQRGPFAYICGHGGNFMIYRVDSMRVTGQITCDARDVAVQGNFAYVCDGGTNFRVLSIYDPYNIQTRANLSLTCKAVAVRGKYAFVAGGSVGLISVDISDTSNPVPKDTASWMSTRDAIDIDVFGDYAFVLDGTNKTLVTVNISDPTNLGTPNIMSPPYGTAPRRLFVSGYKAYITLQDVVSVVNIKNPASPSRNSSEQPVLKLGGASYGGSGVYKWGQWLFVANNDSGIIVYECAGGDSFLHIRSTTPIYTGTPPTLQPAFDQIVVKNYLVTSDSADVTIRKLFTIDPATSFDDSAVIGEVAVDFVIINNRVYVTDQFLGIVTIDIANPHDLRVLDTLRITAPNHATVGICNWGTDLYIAAGAAGVIKASAANPDHPSYVWQEDLGETEVYDVATDGKYIYAGCMSGTRGIIKIRASDHTPVDTLHLSEPVFGVVYDNGYLFIAANELGLISAVASQGPGDTMAILDTIPATGTARAWDVGIEWPIVAVAMERGGLKIVDVKNPANMTELATIPASSIGRTFGVTVSSNYAFVASTDRVRVVDLRNATNPTIVATSPEPTLPEFARQYGEYVIFSDYSSGIKSWRFALPIHQKFKSSSLLYSKELAGGTQYNRINWMALESVADGDTTDYYLLFSNTATGPTDSFQIISHAQEPPPPPGGGESWYEIEATYQYLWWDGKFTISNATAPPLTRVDTIRIGWDYMAKKAFVVPINVEFPSETITVYFGVDSLASAGYDPELDIPYNPGAYPEAYFRISDPSNPSILYLSRNIVNWKDQSRNFELVINGPRCVLSWEPDSLPQGEFVLDGVNMRLARRMEHSGHGALSFEYRSYDAPWFIKNIYAGWNMVSISAGDELSWSTVFPRIIGYPYEYNSALRRFERAERIKPGRGYFVLSRGFASYRWRGNPALRLQTELNQGWNIIGAIHKNGYDWRNLEVDPPGSILPTIYTYDPVSRGYVESAYGEYGKAYWVFAVAPCRITMDFRSEGTRKGDRYLSPNAPEYYLILLGSNGDKLIAGFDRSATCGFDPSLDFPALPGLPDNERSAYFETNETGLGLTRDIKPIGAEEWYLVVEKPTRFNFNMASLPYGASVYIEQGETRQVINPNEGVELLPGRYRLVIEANFSLPKNLMLGRNYPNPFNASTRISFAIPEDGKATLVITNLLGHKVRTLVDENMRAGHYKVTWDGKSDDGLEMPSGVYFYSLQFKSERKTERMILIK